MSKPAVLQKGKSECLIKKQNGPNKDKTLPAIHNTGQCSSCMISKFINR